MFFKSDFLKKVTTAADRPTAPTVPTATTEETVASIAVVALNAYPSSFHTSQSPQSFAWCMGAPSFWALPAQLPGTIHWSKHSPSDPSLQLHSEIVAYAAGRLNLYTLTNAGQPPTWCIFDPAPSPIIVRTETLFYLLSIGDERRGLTCIRW